MRKFNIAQQKQTHTLLTLSGLILFSFLLALLSGSLFFSLGHSSAEDGGTDVTVTVGAMLAITTSPSLSIPIVPTPTGTLAMNDLTVLVSTNNQTGYTLLMNTETNDTFLAHQTLSDTVPSTTATQVSPAALATNRWGYSLATSPTTFSAIPPLSTPNTIAETNAPGQDSSTKVTFAANLDSTVTSGTYLNTVVFTATANFVPPMPIITRISPTTNWNTGDIYITGTDLGGATSITVGGTPCLSFKSISSTSASCVLPPQTNGSVNPVVLTNSLGASNSNRTVTYDGAVKGIMQEFSSTACEAMPLGLAQNWTDARDGNQYRIKKMLDNKCWMIDNLAYAGGGTNTYGDVVPIGSGTGNITFATACVDATAPCTGASPWTTSTGTTQRYMTTNNYTGGDLTDRNGNTIQNTTATLADGTQCNNSLVGTAPMQSECLSYLYNWCAAIGLDSGTTPTCSSASNSTSGAGHTTTGVIGVSSDSGGKGGESKGSGGTSICPTGWRLPVAFVGSSDNTLNEFAILNASMNSNAYNPTPNTGTGAGLAANWHPAGSFSGIGSGIFNPYTGLLNQSTNGLYWSSSLYSSSSASRRSVGYSLVTPGTDDGGKRLGFAVRCVL